MFAGAAPLAVRRSRAAAQQPFGKRLYVPPGLAAPRRTGRAVSRSSSSSVTTAPAPDTPSAAASAAAGKSSAQYDPPHFSDLPLDRSGSLRKQEQQLQQLLGEPSTKVLLLHRGRLLVAPAAGAGSSSSSFGPRELPLQAHSFAQPGAEGPDGGPPRWVPLTAGPQQLQPQAAVAAVEGSTAEGTPGPPDFLFLGREGCGAAVFACQVPAHLLPLLPPTDAAVGEAAGGPCFVDVRGEGQRMAGQDAAVAALAAGLVQWHASAAFCSRTGAPTVRRIPGRQVVPHSPPACFALVFAPHRLLPHSAPRAAGKPNIWPVGPVPAAARHRRRPLPHALLARG